MKAKRNKKTFVINGKFMSERMQGIVRYGRELLNAMDALLFEEHDFEVELAIPFNTIEVPNYENIKIIRLGKRTGIVWEQIDLGKYIRNNKNYMLINLCNVTPLFVRPGITTIHDIMYKVNTADYTTFRNRLSSIWHRVQYTYIARHEKIILTDSEYSKSDIEKHYRRAKGKIIVIPCGWQHVLEYKSADDWNERYQFLNTGEYYFSMATLAKNKNGKWILDTARQNPECVFAIAGKYYEADLKNIPSNVYMLGFVSDEDACALIKNCKAFIYPSLYEGFGLPPLEALALGAKVISSDATSLPEVLGNSVHYISPFDSDVNLDLLLTETVQERGLILQKFSWIKSAEILLKTMKSHVEEL